MNFNDLKKQNTLDELFDLWKWAHKCEDNYEETTITEPVTTKDGIFEGISKDAFIRDGYICEKEYKSAPKKILFILKEANIQTYRSPEQLKNPSEDSQVGFYKEYINNNEPDNTPRQHEKMGRMAHYILYNEDTKDTETIRTTLNKTAFMNVNKRGGSAKTNNKKFWNYENKYMPFIKRQIEILNPDVIVMVGKTISKAIIPDDFRCRFIKVYHTAFRYKRGIYTPDGYIKEFIKEYDRFEKDVL